MESVKQLKNTAPHRRIDTKKGAHRCCICIGAVQHFVLVFGLTLTDGHRINERFISLRSVIRREAREACHWVSMSNSYLFVMGFHCNKSVIMI